MISSRLDHTFGLACVSTGIEPTAACPAAGPRRSGPERASDTAIAFAGSASPPWRIRGVGFVFLAICTLVLTLPMSASASAAVDVRIVDPQLVSLPFGKDFEAVSAWLQKRIDKAWVPKIARATDLREKDRLKAERDRELEQVRNDEQVFDGRATGLDQSIVAGEFGIGTNESLFRYKEGEETHYFFMYEGRLWKYLRVLAPGPAYAVRMAQFQRGLGEPLEMGDESDGEGGRRLVTTKWVKDDMEIRLINKRVVYGADVFVFEQRVIAKRLAELRKAKGQGASHSYDSIEIFFLEDPDLDGAPPKQP